MSHIYYNELWLIARDDLEKLLEFDRGVQQQPRTRRIARGLNLILPTYLRYRNLVQRLIVCHDQMVQTQKRALIKRVLDCATGRMLEYKRAIVNLENSDYQWPDDHMNQLKYTPGDVEISVCATGKDVVDQRRKRIQELMEEAHKPVEIPSEETLIEGESASESQETTTRVRRRRVKEEAAEEAPDEDEVPAILRETPEQMAARKAREAAEEAMTKAILLIQSHERGRVGRRVGFEVERIYDYQRKVQTGEIVPTKTPKATKQKAARTIQRAWRRYMAKKRMKKRVERLEELLEITVPRRKCDKVFAKDRENFWKRLEVIPTIAAGVEKAAEEDRARLWKLRGPGLIEDITDEIREWFIVWYNETGHFDVYPAASVGGSVLIATGQTLTPREYLIEKAAKKTESDKAEATTTRAKRKRTPWMPETKAFTLLDATNQDFIDDWSFRDDLDDPPQKVYRDLIMDKLGYELQLEMRQVVDELMRLELRRLNVALRRDYAADKRELDIPKQKSGKKRKRKKRKKRDRLGAVPVEDMFKELTRADIIRDYPSTSINDWLGDLSYQNYEAERELRDYKHRIGEIKEVVMDYCVLPLSSKEIHQVAPLIRSVCICGLAQYGKSFLVNAICSELGALMIDMTPEVLVGKYDSRRDQRKLTNMIAKVAREFAPAVIFVDNAERPWLKKVPVEERPNKPKRFARYFPKLVKSIKRGDQILFLTTSSEPYKARGPFMRIHNKFIMIPLTDYNTMYMIYKDLLMQYHGVDRAIDVSSLAKMSVGIPLEFVRTAVKTVLNVRRRIRLRFQPLTLEEIMEEVLKYEHTPQKTLRQFVKFENRTPLARRRARMISAAKNERERLKAGSK